VVATGGNCPYTQEQRKAGERSLASGLSRVQKVSARVASVPTSLHATGDKGISRGHDWTKRD
jgi:hypothetical protein